VAVLAVACGAPAGPTVQPGGNGGSSSQAPGGNGNPSQPPAPTLPSSEPSPTGSPNADDVRLHGTFTGHNADGISTADATFDVVVVWHRPNEIHDPLNFQFESGSYTFTASASGLCGGSVNEGGPLELWGDGDQGLIFGDPQDRSHEIHATLVDDRLNQGGLQFSFGADYAIPNGNASCLPPYETHAGVPYCKLEFRLATLDSLEPSANCEESNWSWTGHLVEQ
jgi:hypothetical protein